MKNNLRNTETAAALLARVQALKPDSTALWGTMSVSGMMNHCNKIHHNLLKTEANGPRKTPTLKHRMMKIIGLGLMKQLPKNISTPAKATLPDAAEMLHFDTEKNRLESSLKQLAQREEMIHPHHPIFGPLTNSEWGRFVFMHTDHHLRQFGV